MALTTARFFFLAAWRGHWESLGEWDALVSKAIRKIEPSQTKFTHKRTLIGGGETLCVN